MASRTLSEFLKNLPKFSRATEAKFLNSWDRNTQFTLAESNKKIPIASGNLMRSGKTLKARVRDGYIQSAIVYSVPYAAKLNDKDADIDLVQSGKTSYYVWGRGRKGMKKGVRRGTRVGKSQTGELGYLDNAIEQEKNKFMADIEKMIDEEWNKL